MIMKSILAATAVAATLAATAPAADAKIHVNIGIGVPVYDPGYYDPAFDYPPPPPPPRRPRHVYVDPGYDPAYYEEDYGISCGQGRRIVRNAGFYHVSTIECDGQNFKYEADRRGRSYVVKVDSRTGEIIGASRY